MRDEDSDRTITKPAGPHVALHNILGVVDIFKERMVRNRLADLVVLRHAPQVGVVHSHNGHS